MSNRNVLHTANAVGAAEAVYLQPPPGQRYVRSFVFSRRIDAPFARVHLLARGTLVLCLSSALLRTIDSAHPDLVSAALLWIFALLLFLGSGLNTRIARLYFLLTLPTLFSLFTTWFLFNPVPGHVILLQRPVYSGYMPLGLALWEVLWIVIVGGYFLWTRKVFRGVVIATLITFVLTRLFALPEWIVAQVPFFHPLTIFVSDRTLLVAITKVVGYSGMILCTVALVVTSRDTELIGALRQLRLPQPMIFFLSTVFRAFNLALADYDIIHQAQIARAINARPRSFFRRLRDLGNIAVPMVAMMIRRSSEIGDALQARGYRLGQPAEDFFETSPWRPIDWLVLIFGACLLYYGLGPHPDLTVLLQRWF